MREGQGCSTLCRLLVDRHALPEHPLHITLDGGEASETTGPPNKDSLCFQLTLYVGKTVPEYGSCA